MLIRDISVLLMPEFGGSEQEEEELKLLDSWVIGTISEIANRQSWDCLRDEEDIATVASQPEYEIQEPSSEIYQITIPAENKELHVTSAEKLRSFGYKLEQEGSSQMWWYPSGYDSIEQKTRFRLYEVPSTVKTLRVGTKKRTSHEDLTKVSPCPFPSKFLETIKSGTRIMMAFHRLKNQQAKEFGVEFEKRLSLMSEDKPALTQRRVPGVSDIPRRGGWIGHYMDPSHYHNE